MKKRNAVIIFSILFVILLTSFVFAISNTQTKSQCRSECSVQKRTGYKECNNEYKECRIICKDTKKECLNSATSEYFECREDCNNLSKNEQRSCKRECSITKRSNKKLCSKSVCLSECRNNRSECRDVFKENYTQCKENCEYTGLILTQEECEDNGGLYHEICNGPYFDIICSAKNYCICEGNNNYTCPQNYTCETRNIKKFLPRKINTVKGFKDLLGNDLGEIGVCKQDIS